MWMAISLQILLLSILPPWNLCWFLSLHITFTSIPNTQVVIFSSPLLFFAILFTHSISCFQSNMGLWYPSQLRRRLYSAFVCEHSKNRWSKVSISCPQNVHSCGTCMSNFWSLSAVANLLCNASHSMNLYLGCIWACNIMLFHWTFWYWGYWSLYSFFILKSSPLCIWINLLSRFLWMLGIALINFLDSKIFLTTQAAVLGTGISSILWFFM